MKSKRPVSMPKAGSREQGQTGNGRETDETVSLDIGAWLKRRGLGMKIVIQDDRVRRASPDAKLIDAVANGRRWFTELRDGKARPASGDVPSGPRRAPRHSRSATWGTTETGVRDIG